MPTQVQFRRGNTSQHSTFTGAVGELTVDTEKDTLVVHDGTTAGGFPVVTALAKQSIIPSTNGTFSLGNTTNRWANLFLSGNTLVIGDQLISSNSTGFNLSGTIFVSNTQVLNSSEITVTTGITVGNSTVNTQVNSSSITTTTLTGSSISIATGSFIANSTGVFHTGNINAASLTTSGFVANTTALVPTSNTILLGNSTGRFELSANSGNFSGDVTVSGNLTVSGTTTYINSTTLNIGDNIVTLNADVGPGDSPTQNAGLEINRGSGANVNFIWNETDDAWNQGNNNITGYANVSVSVNSALITVGTSFIANTTGAFHTGSINAASFTVGTSFIANSSFVTIGETATKYATLTTSSISQVAFDTFAAATYRSAKYMVQMTSGAAYHMIELSIIHDDTTVYLSQYGEVKSGASLGTFDASISSGTLSVLITPVNSVTVVKSIAKLIQV